MSENTALKLVREDTLDLLTLGIDRRRIRNYVRICTGRVMLTGDLANLAKFIRQNPREVSNDRAEQLLEHVKCKYMWLLPQNIHNRLWLK